MRTHSAYTSREYQVQIVHGAAVMAGKGVVLWALTGHELVGGGQGARFELHTAEWIKIGSNLVLPAVGLACQFPTAM